MMVLLVVVAAAAEAAVVKPIRPAFPVSELCENWRRAPGFVHFAQIMQR